MARNRAAWPVFAVADLSADRSSSRSSTGIALSASSARNSSNVSGSRHQADDRDEQQQERHRRQERVVRELAPHAGDVVRGRPPRGADHQGREPGSEPPDRVHRRYGSTIGRWAGWSRAGGYRGSHPCASRFLRSSWTKDSPFDGVPPVPDHPHGGRGGSPGLGHASDRGSFPLPPRGSSEARGARAQRPEPPGQRSPGNGVERRNGPHSLSAPRARRTVSWPRADRLRRRRPDGRRNGAQPRRRRP